MGDRNVNKQQLNSNANLRKRSTQALLSASCSFLMLTCLALPANAVTIAYGTNGPTAAPSDNNMTLEEYMKIHTEFKLNIDDAQTLKTASAEDFTLVTELEVEESIESVQERERKAAEEAARKLAEEEAKAAEVARAAEATRVAQVSVQEKPVTTYPTVVQGSGVEGLISAARSQIGGYMDCTDLVQNSLAAIGLFERRDQGGYDLGPMDFARFGTQIAASEARAGDLLVRGGHVAIYTGDGFTHSAVHGGWGGNSVVEIGYDADPHSYMVIRI